MHNLFADWYRQVDLDASADRLMARWKCVEAGTAALDPDTVLQLTRVCFGLPRPGAGAQAEGNQITQVFKEADVSLPMKGNEQLLRVLFGATLVQCIESGHELATQASLAVASANCFGLRAPPAITELLTIAETHLEEHGIERRNAALEDPVAAPSFGKLEITQPSPIEIAEASNQNHWGNVQQNFQRLGTWMTQVNTALETITKGLLKARSETSAAFKANADRAALENRIAVLKEECNVLWWLFGERSESVSKLWPDNRASQVCIVLGRDLSSLMSFEEPTPNARSFLLKALSRTSSNQGVFPVKQVLDESDPAWREATVETLRGDVASTGAVTPVHTGIVNRVDGAAGWIDAFAQATGLRPDEALTAAQWAEQAYREALLLRALENARG